MKAEKKYKGSKNPEHLRRIAQSKGYRFSIHDMPHMIALLSKIGIEIQDTHTVMKMDMPKQFKDTDTIAV